MTKTEFEIAYKQGCRKTKNFLLSMGASRLDAEDLSQQAWIRGWEKIDQLNNPSSVVFWVNSIAKNLLIRFFQQQRSRFSEKTPYKLQVLYEGRVVDGEKEITNGILLEQVKGQLTDSDRELLDAQLNGILPSEFSQQKGISQTAMRLRFLRARCAAKKLLVE